MGFLRSARIAADVSASAHRADDKKLQQNHTLRSRVKHSLMYKIFSSRQNFGVHYQMLNKIKHRHSAVEQPLPCNGG